MRYDSTVGGAYLKRPPGDKQSFPPPPAAAFPIGISKGRTKSNPTSEPAPTPPGLDPLVRDGSEKERVFADVSGLQIWEMGEAVLGGLQGVLKLCSQSTEGGIVQGAVMKSHDTFPLPTSRNLLAPFVREDQPWCTDWLMAVCMALNSFCGCQPNARQEEEDGHQLQPVSKMQARVLSSLLEDVARMKEVKETTAGFEWEDFFRTRSVDYKGDEVKTALRFSWANIKPALPQVIGVAQLTDICEQGCRHYIENFPSFLKPPSERGAFKKARVMVRDNDWEDVARGLIQPGVFGVLPESEVFQVGPHLLLNGLFGVEKNEEADGIPIYRLIMNLVPLDDLCQPMAGDIQTLRHWFGMSPFHIEPGDSLVVSSEDLRCFFYTLRLPPCCFPYLCFNKALPTCLVPEQYAGQVCYPCSKVLPMGFLNSVGIAQRVHRVLAQRSQKHKLVRNTPLSEIRKDKILPDGRTCWRVYLDNYDLLEKFPQKLVDETAGEVAPEVQALREEYKAWGLPRHPGEAVSRQAVAEVRGAVIDGVRGLAYPKGQKLSKYVTMAFKLICRKIEPPRGRCRWSVGG